MPIRLHEHKKLEHGEVIETSSAGYKSAALTFMLAVRYLCKILYFRDMRIERISPAPKAGDQPLAQSLK